MKNILLTVAVLLSSFIFAKAQEARKIGDDSKIQNLYGSLKRLNIELNKNKSNTGYIIIYGKDTQIRSLIKIISKKLSEIGVEPARIVFVSAGEEEEWRVKTYFVPPGAVPPTP